MNDSESLNALSLNASMTVKDINASLAWYRDILGFEVGQRYEREGVLRAVQVVAGSVRLLLNPDNGAKGFDRVKGQGISLRLTTAQNIDELAARIQARGGKLDSEPADIGNGRAFRISDPDGFKLVLSSPS